MGVNMYDVAGKGLRWLRRGCLQEALVGLCNVMVETGEGWVERGEKK
jgi:hypothetical protein